MSTAHGAGHGRRDPRPAAVLRSAGGASAASAPRPVPRARPRIGVRSLAAGVAATLSFAGCGDRSPIPLDGSLPDAPAGAEMESALLASAEAWNRGDLDGFMAPYLPSPDLTFSGSGGVRRGFDAVMRRYRENYFESDASLPVLRFEDLETLDVGADHALMLGRYVLLDPGSEAQVDTGFFSLVWVRTVDGWRIMHDHTTAAE